MGGTIMTPFTITVDRTLVTLSDGVCSVSSRCVTSKDAKGLATRLTNDPGLATKWLNQVRPNPFKHNSQEDERE